MSRTDKIALAVFLGSTAAIYAIGAPAWGRYQDARLARTVADVIATNPTPLTCQAAAINTRSAAIAEGVMYWADGLVEEVAP